MEQRRNEGNTGRTERYTGRGESRNSRAREGTESSRNSRARVSTESSRNSRTRAGTESRTPRTGAGTGSRNPRVGASAGGRNVSTGNSRAGGNRYTDGRNAYPGGVLSEEEELARRRAERERRRRREKARRIKKRRQCIGAMLICFLVLTTVFTVRAVGQRRHVDITLKVDAASMLQEEEIPEFTAKASCADKKSDVMLDRKSKYIVQELLDELNAGKGYTLKCDADGTEEGKYSIKIKLSKDMKERLDSEWKNRVTMNMENGTLTVKNKIGEWDGDKFKTWEGDYVTSQFVESEGDTYYFDADGNKVTGEKQIGFYDCVFDEEGKMESRESRLDPNKPMMALTFDDGPGERTGELLDVLEKYNAHATFFMQGVNIPGYEAEVARMLQIGCELGNHSYDHPQLSTLDAAGIQKQIGDTNDLIRGAAGKPATVLRPPYGDIDDNVKANVGLPMILWNIDTLDWKTMDAQATINNVLCNADDGDIVLMHDIHSPSVDAAIYLIPKLIEDGYQLVTVSEMAEERGITMENGAVYTDFNK